MKVNWEEYAALFDALLKGTVAPSEFHDRFFDMWNKDRDAEAAIRAQWPEPYDLILHRQYEAGEISSDEFSRRWRELWFDNPEEDAPKENLIERAMTSVDAYEPDPELREGMDFLNEDDLKREIQQIMDEARGIRPAEQ